MSRQITMRDLEGVVSRPTNAPDLKRKDIHKRFNFPESRKCASCGAVLTFTRYDGARTTCATPQCPPSRTTRWRRQRVSEEGTSGQDRVSYSDTQDRENYTTGE